jgi:Stage III sporulation protein D
LYLKVQQLLTHGETHDADPPPIVSKRRPGPKQPKYGIPPEHWPILMQRVVESKKSLRAIAQEYGVSHETIHRIMLHGQQA